MKKVKKETRLGRTFGLWGITLILVIAFVAHPTEFKWGGWVYGLIWGGITVVIIYLFRGFFEKPIERPDRYPDKYDRRLND
ncbi:MAG: hypothetical protein DDT19_00410 [Syntrophomonadaceae bacterium]|nr:hypothetical protein [Bacillota bacterium]